MPLYEFECRNCKQSFEDLVPISAAPDEIVVCPKCGVRDAVRLMSAPALATGTSGGGFGGGGCAPRGGFT